MYGKVWGRYVPARPPACLLTDSSSGQAHWKHPDITIGQVLPLTGQIPQQSPFITLSEHVPKYLKSLPTVSVRACSGVSHLLLRWVVAVRIYSR